MRALAGLAMTLTATLALAACDSGPDLTPTKDDVSLGSPQAKVTMVEYASVACGACAAFNNTVLPTLKAKYIDTGKVRYVPREYLTGFSSQVAMAGFLLARCAGPEKYHHVTDAIYREQAAMQASGDVRGTLLRIAQSTGMTEAQFTQCISDDKAREALQARVNTYAKRDRIEGTPTIFLNGVKIDPPGQSIPSLAEMETAIDAALDGKDPQAAVVAAAKTKS